MVRDPSWRALFLCPPARAFLILALLQPFAAVAGAPSWHCDTDDAPGLECATDDTPSPEGATVSLLHVGHRLIRQPPEHVDEQRSVQAFGAGSGPRSGQAVGAGSGPHSSSPGPVSPPGLASPSRPLGSTGLFSPSHPHEPLGLFGGPPAPLGPSHPQEPPGPLGPPGTHGPSSPDSLGRSSPSVSFDASSGFAAVAKLGEEAATRRDEFCKALSSTALLYPFTEGLEGVPHPTANAQLFWLSVPILVGLMLMSPCAASWLAELWRHPAGAEVERRPTGDSPPPAARRLLLMHTSSILTGPALPAVHAEGSVLALLADQVRQAPQRVAVVDVEQGFSLTYQRLDDLVACLAAALTEAGVGSGDVVAVIMETSSASLVAVLAVMRSGAAWLPLDPSSPADRLEALLESAGASLLLLSEADQRLAVRPPAWRLSPAGELVGPPVPLPSGRAPAAPGCAAIFFTSGSTGKPKAVALAPGRLLHSALAFSQMCQLSPDSVVLAKSPLTWAVCEYELFGALVVGSKCIFDAKSQRDVRRLAATITEFGVTAIVTSAPVLQMLADEFQQLPTLRHAVNIGAGLPMAVCAAVQSAYKGQVMVHNAYGCTETPATAWTYHPRAGDQGPALAGQPQAAVQIMVVDSDLQPVPAGELGEVCFAGAYLAVGYLSNQEETNRRFRTGPDGARLYRTGDLGRLVPDPADLAGVPALQVEGRVDRQLNLRGLRVAPEEIEGQLLALPGVAQAAVVADDEGPAGQIVAFLAGDSAACAADVVRGQLLRKLPAHMCPTRVVHLDPFPQLSSGKPDLQELTKRARQLASEEGGMQEVVDSLGQMRLVTKQAAMEFEVLAVARAVASVAVIDWHWFWEPSVQVYSPNQNNLTCPTAILSPWAASVVGGLIVTDWSMQLFVMASAYQDRVFRDTHRRQRPWKSDVLTLLLLVVCYWPLPLLFQFLWASVLQNIDPATQPVAQPGAVESRHRWYLWYQFLFSLLDRGLGPLLSALQQPGRPQWARWAVPALLLVALVVFLEPMSTAPDVCDWLHVPAGSPVRELVSWVLIQYQPDTCFFLDPKYRFYLCTYAVTWFVSPWVVKALRSWELVRKVGVLPPLALFLTVTTTVGALHVFELLEVADASVFPVFPGFPPRVVKYPGGMSGKIAVDVALACLVFWMVAQVGCTAWARACKLAWMGEHSLGSYITNFYMVKIFPYMHGMCFFYFRGVPMIPAPGWLMARCKGLPGGVVLQLILLIVYPITLMLTIGPRFQQAILGLFDLPAHMLAFTATARTKSQA